jgi:hypothetical protein
MAKKKQAEVTAKAKKRLAAIRKEQTKRGEKVTRKGEAAPKRDSPGKGLAKALLKTAETQRMKQKAREERKRKHR